jgi:putative flippase GtrA
MKSSHSIDKKEIIRFIISGSVNTVFSYSIYAIFIFFGFSYLIANFFALALGIVLGFILSGKVVFRLYNKRVLVKYLLGWAFIYSTISPIIGILCKTGFNPYASGLIALPFSALASYLVQKYFVFN